MDKISAVIITHNEEKNIERCLLSLKDVVDEIVVLDSFSTDRTEELCRKYGAHFHQRAWAGYSDSKNHANSLAEHDWILSIDADEALSEELKESILTVKQRLEYLNVYSFNRKTSYRGTWILHCGWYPDVKIRLFHRKTAVWKGEIHETVSFSEGVTVSHLKGDLLHYSFYTEEEFVSQTTKFALMGAQSKFASGQKSNALNKYLRSISRFLKDFVLKTGFLQWPYGFTICRINAWGAYIKYQELERLSRKT